MKELILLLAGIVNGIHDVLLALSGRLGFQLTDKDLHFWIVGMLGIGIFFLVYVIFRSLEKLKWSTAVFSFIYTFTIMVVFVFAIEIQQAITNRGNMEFADAVIGLWGFLVFFFVYALLAVAGYFTINFYKNKKQNNRAETDQQTVTRPKYRSDYHQR